jgi:hypothetical protein
MRLMSANVRNRESVYLLNAVTGRGSFASLAVKGQGSFSHTAVASLPRNTYFKYLVQPSPARALGALRFTGQSAELMIQHPPNRLGVRLPADNAALCEGPFVVLVGFLVIGGGDPHPLKLGNNRRSGGRIQASVG